MPTTLLDPDEAKVEEVVLHLSGVVVTHVDASDWGTHFKPSAPWREARKTGCVVKVPFVRDAVIYGMNPRPPRLAYVLIFPDGRILGKPL